jgi:hypothetical protein
MKTPIVKMYAISKLEVNLGQLKKHLRKFRAKRISTLEGDAINSIIFHVPVTQTGNVWIYLRKKEGIKKVWLGK